MCYVQLPNVVKTVTRLSSVRALPYTGTQEPTNVFL